MLYLYSEIFYLYYHKDSLYKMQPLISLARSRDTTCQRSTTSRAFVHFSVKGIKTPDEDKMT